MAKKKKKHPVALSVAQISKEVMKKRRLTDAGIQEIKNEVKAIIKKIKEKVLLLRNLKVYQMTKTFL